MIGSRLSQLPLRLLAASLLTVGVPSSLDAQETLSSLQGTVRNESAHPVEQALVLLDPGQRQRELRTDRDGRFRFIGVTPGTHQLRILRIGFQPRDTAVTVAGAETSIEVTLERLTALREVAVVGRRTGLYGSVVSRDSLKPLDGARVELLGARTRDTTDATGEFVMAKAKPGTYMLRVTREGFDTRILSVRVPVDTGVGVDVVLKPGSHLLDAHMEMLWAEMSQRINWKGVDAAVVGRDELLSRGKDLEMALKFAPSSARKGIFIDDMACVYVNGVARPMATIRDFSVDEVESIEIYPPGTEYTKNLMWRWPPKGMCGNPSGERAPRGALRAAQIVIWTRR